MTDRYVSRAANVASRILGDETVIMNPADSTLFTLNDTGTAIWQAADGSLTLRQIVDRDICSEFEVEFDSAMADAEEFAMALAAHEILILSDGPRA